MKLILIFVLKIIEKKHYENRLQPSIDVQDSSITITEKQEFHDYMMM